MASSAFSPLVTLNFSRPSSHAHQTKSLHMNIDRSISQSKSHSSKSNFLTKKSHTFLTSPFLSKPRFSYTKVGAAGELSSEGESEPQEVFSWSSVILPLRSKRGQGGRAMTTVSSFACSSVPLTQGRTKRQTYFQFQKEGVKCMLGQERNNLKSGTTSCRHHNNIVQPSLTKHTFLTKKRHGISSGKSFGSTNASPVFEGSRFELILEKIDVLLRFFRLPAVLCTVVGVISLSFLPVEAMSDLSPTFFLGLLKTLIPVVLMNLYTLGINQVYDVELDKVNKPYLPLASGELSVRTGVGIVALCSSTSIALAYLSQSPPLLLTVLTFFTFGGVYSVELPFMRWKKNAFLAVLCIVAMRGVALHVGTLLHVQGYVLGKPMVFTRPMIFTTIFMCTFKFVISLLKDLPDVDGDIAHDVQNFTVKFGKEKIFWLCNSLMLVAYGVAMVMGASSPILYSKLATIIGHGILASVLWLRARSIDLSDDSQTASFYLFVWKLIYVEYLLIHFVR